MHKGQALVVAKETMRSKDSLSDTLQQTNNVTNKHKDNIIPKNPNALYQPSAKSSQVINSEDC